MSLFLNILRCILCCEEDLDYSEVPLNDTLPRTVAPTIDAHFIGQSNAQTTRQIQRHDSLCVCSICSITAPFVRNQQKQIQTVTKEAFDQKPKFSPPSPTLTSASQNWNLSCSKFHQTSITPTVQNQQREKLTVSNFKPKTVTLDSEIKPEITKRTLDKFIEASQKSKVLPPSTTPNYASPNWTINPDASKATSPKLPHNSSSFSSQPSQFSSKPAPSVSKPPPSISSPSPSSSKQSPSLSGPPPSFPKSASSSFGTPPCSPTPPVSTKPALSLAPFNPTTCQTKTNYIWVEKGTSPLYAIPEDIKRLIKKDIVPEVLKTPLSPSTYKNYFAALLYAEDYYHEKWEGFKMENVTLELHEAAIYDWKSKHKNLNKNDRKDDRIFVAFRIDSVPERRPFLISRDYASVRPSHQIIEPFQGIIYRVVKGNLVLVEFGEDFHYQHDPACNYDVKFSFNRICLKRAHQAVAAASDVLFRNFLFPDCLPKINLVSTQFYVNHELDSKQVSAVRRILSLQGPPPYLVEGPLSVTRETHELSDTGIVVREAVLQICQTSPLNRILICAPTNVTCDILMVSLMEKIPESDMCRANAAFREKETVHEDILPSCLYEGECFSCPSLEELRKFKVIFSTFMSSFRLRNEGILAGHFTHIFLVDASFATEPEALVVLANLTNEKTIIVINGAPRNCSRWVRSKIARQNGLMRSYFERLRDRKLYHSLDPNFITQLEDSFTSPSFY